MPSKRKQTSRESNPPGSLDHRADTNRPWPPPKHPWLMRMQWYSVLFAHWPVEARLLEPYLLPGLELDLWEDQAWLSIVPFGMKGVSLRGFPSVPSLSSFLECNVRTYVVADGKPGALFLSIEANSKLAVRAARWGAGLPYCDADMRLKQMRDGTVFYQSTRTHADQPSGEFIALYRPEGEVFYAEPGSFDYWLCERYCLYTYHFNKTLRGEINHPNWPLQKTTCEIKVNTLTHGFGFSLDEQPAHMHFSPHIHAHAWMFEPITQKAPTHDVEPGPSVDDAFQQPSM